MPILLKFPTRPKYYVPRNPYQTPPYYPQALNAVLSSPALFAQLDIETLFYVFYYLPGTYQQWVSLLQYSYLKLNHSHQIPSSERAEATIMAIPCQIPYMVPTSLRTPSHHRRVRTRSLRILRLGRFMVSTQEERFPLRIPISFRRLSVFIPSLLFASFCRLLTLVFIRLHSLFILYSLGLTSL